MSDSGKGNLSRSAAASFLGIFGSRIFGLLRDMVMSAYWGGSGAAQAAFHLAFAIPNTFRGLFGEGAFTAAFVPAVTEKLSLDDREGAWRLAERTISLQGTALFLLIAFVSLVCWGVGQFLPADTREHIVLTFRILPLLLPYALLICVTGAFAGILNSLRSFAVPNANPILFNLVQIGTLFLLWKLGWKNNEPRSLYLFCFCILIAGLLQMVALMIACRRRGFVFHFHLDVQDSEVRGVVSRFLPATLGSGAALVNQLIDKCLVGILGAQAVAAMAYSQRIVYVPVGLFGVAMGIVSLPAMTAARVKNDQELLASHMDSAARQILFMSLPCAILFGALAKPILSLFFQRGAFTADDVAACAQAFLFYLPGIPAFCLMKIAINPHYANKDTTTPVRVSLCCIALNLILNLILMHPLRQGGLALATSITSWCNFLVVTYLGRKYLPAWKMRTTFYGALRLLLAAVLCGICAWLTYHHLAFSWNLLRLLCACGVGGLAYLLACILLRAPEWRDLLLACCRRRNHKEER